MRCCPNCGYEETLPVAEELGLTKCETLVFEALQRRKRVQMHTFVEELWGDDPEGGPDAPEQVIRVFVSNIRNKIKAKGLGYKITPGYGLGYSLEKTA